MELLTRWEKAGRKIGRKEGREEGRAEGRLEGARELVFRMMGKRFGSNSPQISEWLDRLSSEQLDELCDLLFDFTEIAELEDWLKQRAAP